MLSDKRSLGSVKVNEWIMRIFEPWAKDELSPSSRADIIPKIVIMTFCKASMRVGLTCIKVNGY